MSTGRIAIAISLAITLAVVARAQDGGGCDLDTIARYVLAVDSELAGHHQRRIVDTTKASCAHFCDVNRDETGDQLSCKAFGYVDSQKTCYLYDEQAGGSEEARANSTAEDRGVLIYEKACLTASHACSLIPAFERSPNRILRGFTHVILEKINSAEACMSACLRSPDTHDFQCMSIMYYTETKECLMNFDTKVTPGVAEYFSNETENYNVDYYDNLCAIRKRDGGISYNACPDRSTPTFYRINTTEQATESAAAFSGLTLSECLKRCNEAENFTCNSVAYRSTDEHCSLSFETRRSSSSRLLTRSERDGTELESTTNTSTSATNETASEPPATSNSSVDLNSTTVESSAIANSTESPNGTLSTVAADGTTLEPLSNDGNSSESNGTTSTPPPSIQNTTESLASANSTEAPNITEPTVVGNSSEPSNITESITSTNGSEALISTNPPEANETVSETTNSTTPAIPTISSNSSESSESTNTTAAPTTPLVSSNSSTNSSESTSVTDAPTTALVPSNSSTNSSELSSTNATDASTTPLVPLVPSNASESTESSNASVSTTPSTPSSTSVIDTTPTPPSNTSESITDSTNTSSTTTTTIPAIPSNASESTHDTDLVHYERACIEGARLACGGDNRVAFELTPNRRMPSDFTVVTISGISSEECLSLCLLDPSNRCRSVTYELKKSLCHLSNATKEDAALLEASDDASANYYENLCYTGKVTLISDPSEGTPTSNETEAKPRPSTASGVPKMEMNPICDYSDMRVRMTAEKPFTGFVFAKNKFGTCRVDVENRTEVELALKFPDIQDPEGPCGVLEIGNGIYSVIVVATANNMDIPGLVTETDRFFNITCDFTGSFSNLVTATGHSMAVNNPKDTPGLYPDGIVVIPSPLNIQLSKIDAPSNQTRTAVLGELMSLDFRYYPGFNRTGMGLFVRQCNASRYFGPPPEPEPLILLEDGCPSAAARGRIINTTVVETEDGFKLPFTAFRFDGSNAVKITCAVDMCEKGCNPIHCPIDGKQVSSFGKRRKRSLGDRKPTKPTSLVFTVVDQLTHDALLELGSVQEGKMASPQARSGYWEQFVTQDPIEKKRQVCLKKSTFLGVTGFLIFLCFGQVIGVAACVARKYLTKI